jgi:hypothetical protein
LAAKMPADAIKRVGKIAILDPPSSIFDCFSSA